MECVVVEKPLRLPPMGRKIDKKATRWEVRVGAEAAAVIQTGSGISSSDERRKREEESREIVSTHS